MKRERKENDNDDEKTSKSSTSHDLKRTCSREIKAAASKLPLDLKVEILKKFPRRQQWSTIISSRKEFIDSIVTRSLAKPLRDDLHFIFHHSRSSEPFFFFSSTYTHKEHAVSITGIKILRCSLEFQYVRGLICYSTLISHDLVTIYNPTTRKSISLPDIKSPNIMYRSCFFGYDSVMDQYKVMSVINRLEKTFEHVCQVFTLGDPMKQWRNIQGIVSHCPINRGVHINGTIYYGGNPLDNNDVTSEFMLVSFDVRFERFDHINAPMVVTNDMSYRPTLVNYKGKLGCFCYKNIGVEMWVMEDVEKQEWSNTISCLPNVPLEEYPYYDLCVTLGGKIFVLPT
ncbi:hypothetical protein ARALYDRAFT_343568 [Arabidopsis lyrata subsp. lyrata]|uniref:F-box associated beta-propeller type 3 domain-containing protein n=1 Tax=Arabidopsis lyrata subsp. lyrata TaxID=81972 RepID=D7L2S4_ARALL|nr:hypothetical protein ARALYDRAFT_343568 [Arabidopsis lyrata subsp. lyrata]